MSGAVADAWGLPETAYAASEPYNLVWIIDPVQANLSERTVKPGDVIAEAVLLPISLLTIDSDALAADGSIAARVGAQFTVLQSRVRSACTFTFRPAGALQRHLFGEQRYACLVDEDGDGFFESSFGVTSSKIGIPLSHGKIPKRRTAIKPVAYRKVSLGEGADFPRLLFKYSHQDKITGHAYFGMCVANSSRPKEPCFDGYSGVRSNKLPKEIGAGGALALATAKQGAAVNVTLKRGFKRQPFVAMEYVRWSFY